MKTVSYNLGEYFFCFGKCNGSLCLEYYYRDVVKCSSKGDNLGLKVGMKFA